MTQKNKIRLMGLWNSQGQPIPEIWKLPNRLYSSKTQFKLF